MSDHPQSAHEQDRACIALAVFAEARSESWLGQALVAQVIKNRMGEDRTACDVINAPGQFAGIESWRYPRAPWAIDERAWTMAQEVTDAVFLGDYMIAPPACARATFFHHTAITPAWASSLQHVCTVGAHAFYAAN